MLDQREVHDTAATGKDSANIPAAMSMTTSSHVDYWVVVWKYHIAVSMRYPEEVRHASFKKGEITI